MFRRRREEPAASPPEQEPPPPPATVARPARARPAWRGWGCGQHPRGLGARLRAILGSAAGASQATWDEVEEALIAADVGADDDARASSTQRARGSAAVAGARVRDPGGARLGGPQPGSSELARARSSSARRRRSSCSWGSTGRARRRRSPSLPPGCRAEGHSLALAAADTFRAAAIEQLRIWGELVGVPVVAQRAGADAGAVAFDAVAAAESRGLDAVLVDTAGRLQNKVQLMAELAKVRTRDRAPTARPAAARAAGPGCDDRAERPPPGRGVQPRGGRDRASCSPSSTGRPRAAWRSRSRIAWACQSSSRASGRSSMSSHRSTRAPMWSGCSPRDRVAAMRGRMGDRFAPLDIAGDAARIGPFMFESLSARLQAVTERLRGKAKHHRG